LLHKHLGGLRQLAGYTAVFSQKYKVTTLQRVSPTSLSSFFFSLISIFFGPIRSSLRIKLAISPCIAKSRFALSLSTASNTPIVESANNRLSSSVFSNLFVKQIKVSSCNALDPVSWMAKRFYPSPHCRPGDHFTDLFALNFAPNFAL